MTAEVAHTSTADGDANSIGPPHGSPEFAVDAEDLITPIDRIRTSDDLAYHRGRFPRLDLPSFGEPDDKCGEIIPESTYFCPKCGAIHEKPHLCYRYDCPMHWAHAIRRRTKGTSDASGLAPFLDAMRRYLNAWRDDNQYFHHLVVSPEQDLQMVAGQPLERGKKAVRELMDALGIQGVVVYHPWRLENETHDGNDLGDWKRILGADTEWEDIRDELVYEPHFHIVGVAPFVDLSASPDVHETTDWILHRITQDDSNISIEDDTAMIRALTYALSHAGVYSTPSDARYLGAWRKGPDVNRVQVYESNKRQIQAQVDDAVVDTLGIPPSDMSCDRSYQPEIQLHREHTAPASIDALASEARDPGPLGSSDPRGAISGPTVTHSSDSSLGAAHPGGTQFSDDRASVDGTGSIGAQTGGVPESPSRLDHADSPAGGGGSSSTAPGDPAGAADEVEDATEPCGGRLVHISRAGEYVLDSDWRETAPHADRVDHAYREYVHYMRAKHRDPIHDVPTIPEFHRQKGPPPD